MDAPARVRLLSCPFLKWGVADPVHAPHAQASCQFPAQAVRFLSREAVARLCTNGHYFDCPGYRFWRPARTAWPNAS